LNSSTIAAVIVKIETVRLEDQNPSTAREKKSRGKKWCSFNISSLFAQESMPPLEQDIYDLSTGYFGKRKSIAYTNPMFLLEAVKEEGWHGEGAEYLVAVLKRLGLWEKFLKIPGFVGGEKQIFELLKHYAPNEIL